MLQWFLLQFSGVLGDFSPQKGCNPDQGDEKTAIVHATKANDQNHCSALMRNHWNDTWRESEPVTVHYRWKAFSGRLQSSSSIHFIVRKTSSVPARDKSEQKCEQENSAICLHMASVPKTNKWPSSSFLEENFPTLLAPYACMLQPHSFANASSAAVF